MDNLLLQTLVGELRAALVGWPVFRIGFPEPDTAILLFDDPARRRLLVSVAAGLPRVHLTRRRLPRSGRPPSGFEAAVSHHLTGAILSGIEKDPAERVVAFCFAGPSGPGKRLVAEVLGRSSNLLLLDAEGSVLGFLRRLKSEFRAPVLVVDPRIPPQELLDRALVAGEVRARRGGAAEAEPVREPARPLLPEPGCP